MARVLSRLAAAVALWLLPTPGFAGAITPDHQCMGPWVGRGRNTGFTTYWTIDLNLMAAPDGGRCGTIRYTNPNCHGFLDSCQLVGQDIHTQENYTRRGRCAPPGRVIIRCENNQMRYSWIGWERVDTMLRRPDGYRPPPGTPAAGTAPTQPSTPPVPAPPTPPGTAPMAGGGTMPPVPPPVTQPPDSSASGFNCLPACSVTAQRRGGLEALVVGAALVLFLSFVRRRT